MLLSVMGITLEEIEISAALPINPTIIRIMRVLRIARGTSGSVPEAGHAHAHAHAPTLETSPSLPLDHAVLKLLKMATGMRALLDTVVQALPQVNTQPSCTHSQRNPGPPPSTARLAPALLFFLSCSRHFLQVGESSAPQRVSLARAHAVLSCFHSQRS